ncbi:MAG: hypothetical protein QGF67_16090 [Lentisphaeria bacterium]|nr:hypothetical protein [Lentisphaeria bacterium]
MRYTNHDGSEVATVAELEREGMKTVAAAGQPMSPRGRAVVDSRPPLLPTWRLQSRAATAYSIPARYCPV